MRLRHFVLISCVALLLGCEPSTDETSKAGGENGDKQGSSPIDLSLEHSHAAELEEICAAGEYEKDDPVAELCAEFAATHFYKDLRDGGNNIFEPGCHRYYAQAGCPVGTGKLWASSGDKCFGTQNPKKIIAEWTNPGCHPKKPVDSSRFDCEKECQRRGSRTGVCITVPNFCAKGINSARCECIDF